MIRYPKYPQSAELEAEILAACEWAKAQGLKIESNDWGIARRIDGTWVTYDGSCCPLGALVLQKQPMGATQVQAAMEITGENAEWVNSFIAGVDGKQDHRDLGAYEMGEDIITKVAKRSAEQEMPPLKPENIEPEAPPVWHALEAVSVKVAK